MATLVRGRVFTMLYRFSLSCACARTCRDNCRSLNVEVAGADDMVTNFTTNRHPRTDIKHEKIALAVTSILLSLRHHVAKLLGLLAQSLLESSAILNTPITSNKFCCQTHFFTRSRHCAAAFFLQVPEKCTDPALSLLYIMTLEKYTKFA